MLQENPATTRLRVVFHRHHGLRCGFCTAGMLVTATELLDDTTARRSLTDESVRETLSGNVCRCTGYQGIVRAVLDAAEDRPPPDMTTFPGDEGQ